ncbi:chorismate mutase [Pseudoclavibacter sp. RFBA6]|uniref:chorismate mutase n=1 Tax=Pseudoclavibacter sp. RFBA6 TaxID=2080573 RepID=UPI000CE8A422|nr:chorismate mutase [Pseudoclavibacter sp. RFBA6]PPG38781.1 chorismate mutase [Pseudoclavibacter sp. RFBA6]
MTGSTGPHDMTGIRAAIDSLDAQIVALIGQRQRWVERAAVAKRGQDQGAVRAPARVGQVISKVRGLAESADASPDVVEATYRAMIGAFIDLELREHAGEATLGCASAAAPDSDPDPAPASA